MKRTILFLALLALLLSQGCGSDDNPTSPGGPQTREILPPDADGMLLPGAESDNAAASTVSLAPSPAPPGEIDGALLTTRLAAVIAPGATVGEVNSALAARSAAVVSMVEGDPYVVLVVPAVEDRAEAEEAAAALVATGTFVYARPGHTTQRKTETAPVKDFPHEDARAGFAHLAPSRTLAAWNLRRAAEDRATLVVPDWYVDVPGYFEIPDLEFAQNGGRPLTPADDFLYAAGSLGFYHLGVSAADWAYDPDLSPHTGTDPVAAELLDVVAVHTYGLDDVEMMVSAGFNIPADDKTVLLTTVTFDDPEGELIRFYDRAWLALYWRRMVYQIIDGPNFVHIVSAGQSGASDGTLNLAILNSTFALATVEDLAAFAGIDAAETELAAFEMAYQTDIANDPRMGMPLTNVIIAGSSGITGAESGFSTPGAQVRTVGEAVPGPCMVGPQCNGVTMHLDGLGTAAAQVAGLACYLWHLDSDLEATDVLLRLQHAYTTSATPGVLDAWIAALSTDTSIADAPARKKLLDVSGPSGLPDGVFTEHDLTAFISAFNAFGGSIAPDWSVYDLNGDGWTGGPRESSMDLDINNLPGFTTVTRDINGEDVNFNERQLTDEEVLCYYAWSSLYSGDSGQRASLLDCGGGEGLFVRITGLPERASPGETALVTVTAGFNLPGGGVSHEAGIQIVLEPEGLDVVPSSGTTNASGTFLATVTFDDYRNEMTLETWAETPAEEAYATASVLRHNSVELIDRSAYAQAGVYAVYQSAISIPGVVFVDILASREAVAFEPFSALIRMPEGGGTVTGSGAGMTVTGSARVDMEMTLEIDPSANFSGMTLTSETSGSITLNNPNLNVLSYTADSHAYTEMDLEFVIWGEPAIYDLQGSTSSSEYDIDLDGPLGQVFLCDSGDMPCSAISSSGSLPPGTYSLGLYHYDGGRVRWREGCTDCTTSGTQSSSGSLDLTFEIFHAGK